MTQDEINAKAMADYKTGGLTAFSRDLLETPSVVSDTSKIRDNQQKLLNDYGVGSSNSDFFFSNPNFNANYDALLKGTYVKPQSTNSDPGNNSSIGSNSIPDSSGINKLSADDELAAKSAGVAAGNQYDTMIAQQQEEKRQGMADNTISAGERGGFMNTQFAGISALQPTVGRTFTGEGGKLEQMKSAYDMKIADLQSKKLNAIASAEQAYKDYVKSGKQTDFENAVKSYQLAEQHNKDLRDAAHQNLQDMLSIASNQREQASADTAKATAAAPGLVGKTPDEIAAYASANGLDAGVLQGQVYKAMLDAQEKQTLNEQRNIDMISKTVGGGSVNINGKTYKVYGSTPDAPKTIDNGTEIYQQVYDQKTGKWSIVDTGIASHQLTASQSIGILEKMGDITTKPGWDSDPNQVAILNNLGKAYADMTGGTFTPITSSSSSSNENAGGLIEAKYPSGTKGGECVSYARNIVPDLPSGLWSLDDKKKVINVSKNELLKGPQVGDALMIATSTPEGHVAVINAVLPDGKVRVSESNYDKNQTIDNSREVSLSDKNILGAYRGQIAPEFAGDLIMTTPPNPASGNKTDQRTGKTQNKTWDDAISLYMSGKSVQSLVGSMFGSDKKSKAQKNNYQSMIQNTAGAIEAKTGIPSAKAQAMYKANNKAATDIVNRLARVETVNQTLVAQFPRLEELADKVKAFGITESDVQAGAAHVQAKTGSADAASYVELLQTVRSDYAAAQSALAGSRGGLMFVQNANEAIPIGLSADQYRAIGDTINKSIENSKSATNAEANSLFDMNGTVTSFNSTLSKDRDDMDKFIKQQGKIGSDGKLAPWDYVAYKNFWVNQGNKADDFDSLYSFLKDPNNNNY